VGARYGETNEETLAREHLERKRIKKPTNERETARVVRRLVAAGFKTATIYGILRRWMCRRKNWRGWRIWRRSEAKSERGSGVSGVGGARLTRGLRLGLLSFAR